METLRPVIHIVYLQQRCVVNVVVPVSRKPGGNEVLQSVRPVSL